MIVQGRKQHVRSRRIAKSVAWRLDLAIQPEQKRLFPNAKNRSRVG